MQHNSPPSMSSVNNGSSMVSPSAGYSSISGSSQKRIAGAGNADSNEVLDKKRLQELVKEVDPNEQLDEEVETMLLQIADDFIEQVSFTFLS